MATLGPAAHRPLTHRLLGWRWHPLHPPDDSTRRWLQDQTAEARGRAAMLRQYATLADARPTVRALCDESLTRRHNNL